MARSLSTPFALLCQSQRCSSQPHTRKFAVSLCVRNISPESPEFIDIPEPPQQQYPPRPRIKGVLPVPRNIFPSRAANKTSPEYLASVTREPAQSDVTLPNDARASWKRRMAHSRRTNLREGLTELYHRKQKVDRYLAVRGAQRRADRGLLLKLPQREDDRLTAPSVPAAMKKLQAGALLDPNRAHRIEVGAARVLKQQQKKAAERQAALHSLYMRARDFITTEEQLNAVIEKLFVPQPREFSGDTEGATIWNSGRPDSISSLLGHLKRNSRRAISFNKVQGRSSQARLKKIAEELTGGEMD
ncbi:MAG: hypothetical protein M1829_000485 [Trizodia sp. TS-e1964]|nr:MAG: hypothetical protein M1829_000485 [Trizodia sp. TS-e1964]